MFVIYQNNTNENNKLNNEIDEFKNTEDLDNNESTIKDNTQDLNNTNKNVQKLNNNELKIEDDNNGTNNTQDLNNQELTDDLSNKENNEKILNIIASLFAKNPSKQEEKHTLTISIIGRPEITPFKNESLLMSQLFIALEKQKFSISLFGDLILNKKEKGKIGFNIHLKKSELNVNYQYNKGHIINISKGDHWELELNSSEVSLFIRGFLLALKFKKNSPYINKIQITNIFEFVFMFLEQKLKKVFPIHKVLDFILEFDTNDQPLFSKDHKSLNIIICICVSRSKYGNKSGIFIKINLLDFTDFFKKLLESITVHCDKSLLELPLI